MAPQTIPSATVIYSVYRCLQMSTDVYRCLQMSTDVQIMERKNGRLVDIEFVEDTETRNMSEYFENTSSDLAKDGHRPTVTAVAVVTVVTVAAPGAPLTPKAVDAVALLVFTGFHLGLTQ